MRKAYSQMTADERVADRIAKNRESDRRAQEAKNAATERAPLTTTRQVRDRRKPAANALEEFQRIKREQGIDAASDFVRSKSK